MKHQSLLAAAVISGTLAGAARADDGILGSYLGAGIGNANVKIDERPGNIALGLKEHHGAWKVTFGLRPISLLGVEVEYVDLGRVSATLGAPGTATTVLATARQSGGAAYAVGYLPLPVPLLDVFGKVGSVHMQTHVDGSLPAVQCVTAGCNEFHGSSTDTSFAWGAGVQVKLPLTGLAVRGEYERYSVPNGAPDLLSVNLLWHF